MRKLLAAATIATAVAGGAWTASAVQWWTPKEKDCPTFDTQSACVAFCTADPAACGGNTTCVSLSGPTRSPC